MFRALLYGAASGVAAAALLTFVPPWLQGTDLYEWQDSFVVMAITFVPIGALLGAIVWSFRRRAKQS